MNLPRLVRNAAWIDREYGTEKWPAVLSRIESEVSAGETELARVISRVKRWEADTADPQPRSVVVDGRSMKLPRCFALHGGTGSMTENLIALADGADAVIELGSGWGFNLFHLWLNGGPRTARYFALEYTEAGRRCTERLAVLAPTLDIVAQPFDYHAVDLGGLGSIEGRVLVFSCFSIDQIPQLPAAVYRALAAVADRIQGIHFEPAGWQMAEACVGSSAEYAGRHDYNRNLWPLLNQLQAEGVLRIGEVIPEFFGQNPENSASMICWSMGPDEG